MAAKARLEELIAEIQLPIGERAETVTVHVRSRGRRSDPAIGTTLQREWRGQQVLVRVVDGGFEWDGVVHRSLSAVAKAVTGTHWNGRLFFGLVGRKGAR